MSSGGAYQNLARASLLLGMVQILGDCWNEAENSTGLSAENELLAISSVSGMICHLEFWPWDTMGFWQGECSSSCSC